MVNHRGRTTRNVVVLVVTAGGLATAVAYPTSTGPAPALRLADGGSPGAVTGNTGAGGTNVIPGPGTTDVLDAAPGTSPADGSPGSAQPQSALSRTPTTGRPSGPAVPQLTGSSGRRSTAPSSTARGSTRPTPTAPSTTTKRPASTTTAAQTSSAPPPPDPPKSWTGRTVSTIWGPVQVRISVENGRITAAQAVQTPFAHPTSVAINKAAVPTLNSRAEAAQGTAFDAVSGATITSAGYKQSLQSAIDLAHL